MSNVLVGCIIHAYNTISFRIVSEMVVIDRIRIASVSTVKSHCVAAWASRMNSIENRLWSRRIGLNAPLVKMIAQLMQNLKRTSISNTFPLYIKQAYKTYMSSQNTKHQKLNSYRVMNMSTAFNIWKTPYTVFIM